MEGEHGLSSDAMFAALSGVETSRRSTLGQPPAHPRDLDDLRRCMLLVDAVPEFASRVPELARLSATWARLVVSWDAMREAVERESPDWRTAGGTSPTAAALLRDALG